MMNGYMINSGSGYGYGFHHGFFGSGCGWLIAVIIVWSLVWKGLALWKAAREGSRNWFTVLLIVQTLGILEILYLFVFSKPKAHSVK
jgi:preprotein translocase subunit SecY